MARVVVAKPGTSQWGQYEEEGVFLFFPDYILMESVPPDPLYHQRGFWIAQTNGTWMWETDNSPIEYPITRNSATGEIHWSPFSDTRSLILPADIGAPTLAALNVVKASIDNFNSTVAAIALTASQASTAASQAVTQAGAAASTASGLAAQITSAISQAGTATTAATQASQAAAAADALANTAKGTADSVMTAVASMPNPAKWEIVTVTLGTGGIANATFANTYNTSRIVAPITHWVGNVQLSAVLGTPTATGVSVTGKKSVATILLNNSPFVDAVAGDVVKFLVIGR